MSLTSIAAAGFSPRAFLFSPRNVSPGVDTSAGNTLAAPPASPETDPEAAAGGGPLTLPEPGQLQFQGRARLRIDTRTRLRQTEDGDLRLRSQSRLRFSYEFETADGIKVKIKAKAKTQISYKQDGQSGSESIKFKSQVKLHVSLLQEGVASGMAPLVSLGEGAGELGSAISGALEQFMAIVDEVTGALLNTDSLGADDLIVKVVEAFNDLTEAARLMLSPAGEPPVEAPPIGSLPPEAIDPPSDPVEFAETVPDVPAAQPAAGSVQTVQGQDASAADPPNVDPDGTAEDPVVADDLPIDAGPLAGTDVGLPATESGPAASPGSVELLLVEMRMRFVQSLRSLITVFDPPESGQSEGSRDALAFSSFLKVSAKFAYSHQITMVGNSAEEDSLDATV